MTYANKHRDVFPLSFVKDSFFLQETFQQERKEIGKGIEPTVESDILVTELGAVLNFVVGFSVNNID